MQRCAKCGEVISPGASDCARCGALVEPVDGASTINASEKEQNSTSRVGRLGEFILLLIIWSAGACVLVFLALLSISKTIINIMLAISAVSLLVSLVLFFTKRRSAALLLAAGPAFLVAFLLALAVVLPLFR